MRRGRAVPRVAATIMAAVATVVTVLTPMSGANAADEAAVSRSFDPKPQSGVVSTEPVYWDRFTIPMTDHTKLSVSLFTRKIPNDPDHRYPVIIVMGPNFDHVVWDAHPTLGDYYSASTTCQDVTSPGHVPCLVGDFTSYGYAVVHVSMRGTGQSEGTWNYWGPQDASDYRDVIDWFASPKQHAGFPAFGKIGLFGMSAEANAEIAGISRPDGVHRLRIATSVVVQGVTSMYDEYAHDGARFIDGPIAPTEYFGIEAGPRWDPNDLQGSVTADPTGNVSREPGDAVASARDVLESTHDDGSVTQYYRDRNYKQYAKNIDAPVLDVQGTLDKDALPGNLTGWWDGIRTFKRLVLPAFGHNYPPVLEPTYPWWPMFHAWFDRWLLDLNTGVESWPQVQVEKNDADSSTMPYRAVTSFDALAGGILTGTFASGGSFGETGGSLTVPLKLDVEAPHLAGQATVRLALKSISATPANIQVDLQENDGSSVAHVVSTFCRYEPDRSASTDPEDHCKLVSDPTSHDLILELRSATFERAVPAGSMLQLLIKGAPDLVHWIPDADVQIAPARSGYVAVVDPAASSIELPQANDGTPLCIGTACE